MIKIVADSHIPRVNDYFSKNIELILKSGRQINADDVHDAEMLLVRSITPVTAELLQNSSVKFVGSMTAGADHLDTDWMAQHGIAWATAHGFNAPPVADYVVSVIAALQRKGLLLRKNMRAAVIGVGCVGRLVVKYLQLLGFEVIVCDPVRAAQEPDFISTPLAEIADVDLISLHVPLTTKGDYPTHHMIEQHFLQRQKMGCVLVNASRGSVISSQDLLLYGAHLHWCLDVWEHEPKIDPEVLEQALIATPHIAGYSVQSKLRGTDMIYHAACAQGFLSAGDHVHVEMPTQTLTFAGSNHHWQDVVLGIFNPLIMTAMMRTALEQDQDGHEFDHLRNSFNYRHEFSATTIKGVHLSETDKVCLQGLGIGGI